MPSRNSIKEFGTDQMWHVYNRGTDGRNIFTSKKDYAVFLSFLKICLADEKPSKETLNLLPESFDVIKLRRLNLYKEVELVSYCLMPNHFHLQLFQYTNDGITKLMRSVITGYVMYFNRTQQRSGHLFQGIYKASHIDSDSYWQHISRYIHLNPLDIGKDYRNYDYSSYKYYTKYTAPTWLQSGYILGDFKKDEYESFVADFISYRNSLKDLKAQLADV